jgi:hypothetical protein
LLTKNAEYDGAVDDFTHNESAGDHRKVSGAIAFFFMLLPTLFYQIFILAYSSPRMAFGPIFSGYWGCYFSGRFDLPGIFISTLTENQIVAASVTFRLF